MNKKTVKVGTLHPDGSLTHSHEFDPTVCPFTIFEPEHYREDGTCKCNDPEHRKLMRSWGYRAADFRSVGLK